MDHFISQIEIQNFKSIRNLEVSGFKRINLFIGRPNVGKSNILEALSLFAAPYLWNTRTGKLSDIVRLHSPRAIFYEGEAEKDSFVSLKANEEDIKENCHIIYSKESGELILDIFVSRPTNPLNGIIDPLARNGYYPSTQYRVEFIFDMKLKKRSGKRKEYFATPSPDFINHIKPYSFKEDVNYQPIAIPFLNPPFGENLLEVLESLPDYRAIYSQWFKQFGLTMVLDRSSNDLKLQKTTNTDEVFQLPLASIADTLQRVIFHKTAIASNRNSILLFEEPEAHEYPPYIAEFTQEVIRSLSNQFFIVTHSPLIVEQFLTDALDDLGIFMVDYKDRQTIVKSLTTEEIKEIYRYGMDLFFNGDSYLD